MKKFRIVKITETNDLGDNKINYIIQKKLWFLWYDYKIARVNYVGLAMRSTVKKEKILFDNYDYVKRVCDVLNLYEGFVYKRNKIKICCYLSCEKIFYYIHQNTFTFVSFKLYNSISSICQTIDSYNKKIKKTVIE